MIIQKINDIGSQLNDLFDALVHQCWFDHDGDMVSIGVTIDHNGNVI